MIPAAIARLIILVIGVLYPAYQSHKTIRTKNAESYVRWTLYWIAYSLFVCAETFTDIFIAWLPVYYELKIMFVIWLVLPLTDGGNLLFRFVIRPQFSRWEKVADQVLATFGRLSLSYSLVFLTRGLHCTVDFVTEKALQIYSKVVGYVEQIISGALGRLHMKRESETELNRFTEKKGRKATGLKIRKVEITQAEQLSAELDQLCDEMSVRTTRAHKYVYC